MFIVIFFASILICVMCMFFGIWVESKELIIFNAKVFGTAAISSIISFFCAYIIKEL